MRKDGEKVKKCGFENVVRIESQVAVADVKTKIISADSAESENEESPDAYAVLKKSFVDHINASYQCKTDSVQADIDDDSDSGTSQELNITALLSIGQSAMKS